MRQGSMGKMVTRHSGDEKGRWMDQIQSHPFRRCFTRNRGTAVPSCTSACISAARPPARREGRASWLVARCPQPVARCPQPGSPGLFLCRWVGGRVGLCGARIDAMHLRLLLVVLLGCWLSPASNPWPIAYRSQQRLCSAKRGRIESTRAAARKMAALSGWLPWLCLAAGSSERGLFRGQPPKSNSSDNGDLKARNCR